MKTPRIHPYWALLVGFVIAPLACVCNSMLFTRLVASPGSQFGSAPVQIGFLSLFLTGPMGYQTTKLLEIWEKGQYSKARGMGLSCGFFSALFWFWAYNEITYSSRWGGQSNPSLFAGLLIPFVWTILFPLVAIFVRVPRKSGLTEAEARSVQE